VPKALVKSMKARKIWNYITCSFFECGGFLRAYFTSINKSEIQSEYGAASPTEMVSVRLEFQV
jgi:hypothetical protein